MRFHVLCKKIHIRYHSFRWVSQRASTGSYYLSVNLYVINLFFPEVRTFGGSFVIICSSILLLWLRRACFLACDAGETNSRAHKRLRDVCHRRGSRSTESKNGIYRRCSAYSRLRPHRLSGLDLFAFCFSAGFQWSQQSSIGLKAAAS